MLKRFIGYYRPYKNMFILDMLASLFISLIGLVYPMVTNRMLNDLIPNKKYSGIIIGGILVLVLYFIRMLLRYFVQYYGHMIGTNMQANMRRDMFKHLETLPFTYFDNHETGRILSRMTNDLFDVAELAHHGPENLIVSSLTLIGSFIYLLSINVYLTFIIFACVPILVGVSSYYRKRMHAAFKERRTTTAGINASVESSITGIRVTKAFTNNDTELKKFEENNKLFVEASRKSYNAMGQYHSISSFITDVFNVIIIIAGGLFLYSGDISFGDYTTFIVSVNVFINPVTQLIGFMEQFQNGVSGFERFIEILDEKPEKENDGATDIENVEGEISFKDVSFATICHLIPNFYRVSSGEVLLDGKNVNDITFTSLRKNIGIVQQDVFLFNGTIKENILYGRPDATDEEVIKAAKLSNIYDYVMTLPNGFDSQIGERGVKLSGGQKQRLSIARVFLKDPKVLILDEATSALDNTTEIMIQDALDELCKGRTTIVVAHRLSTIKNADEIAVIEDGKILEKGTHEELIENGKVYKELYNLQFRKNQAI